MSRDPGLLQTDVSPALRWLRDRLLSLARHCLLGLSLTTLGLILAGAAELYTASLDQLSVSRFGGISGFEGGDTLLDLLALFAPETWQMLALLILVLAELAILFPRRIIRLLYHPATALLLFLSAFALLIPAWNIRDQLPRVLRPAPECCRRPALEPRRRRPRRARRIHAPGEGRAALRAS